MGEGDLPRLPKEKTSSKDAGTTMTTLINAVATASVIVFIAVAIHWLIGGIEEQL